MLSLQIPKIAMQMNLPRSKTATKLPSCSHSKRLMAKVILWITQIIITSIQNSTGKICSVSIRPTINNLEAKTTLWIKEISEQALHLTRDYLFIWNIVSALFLYPVFIRFLSTLISPSLNLKLYIVLYTSFLKNYLFYFFFVDLLYSYLYLGCTVE